MSQRQKSAVILLSAYVFLLLAMCIIATFPTQGALWALPLAYVLICGVSCALALFWDAPFQPISLEPDGEKIGSVTLLIPAAIALLYWISIGCNVLGEVFGMEAASADFSESLIVQIARHIVIPVFCEEVMFRFLPLCLFTKKDKWALFLLSVLPFALFHGNLWVGIYAAAAGIVFLALDVYADCLLPSVIIHAFLNAVVVFTQPSLCPDLFARYLQGGITALGILCAILFFLTRKRKIKETVSDEYGE